MNGRCAALPCGLSAAVLSLVLAGCGGGLDRPELVQVSGTATHMGTPVKNIEVRFNPTQGGRASSGYTDESGKFTLMYTRDTPGVVKGEHAISVTWVIEDPEIQTKMSANAGFKAPAPYGEILAKYGDSATSTLKLTVNGNEENLAVTLD